MTPIPYAHPEGCAWRGLGGTEDGVPDSGRLDQFRARHFLRAGQARTQNVSSGRRRNRPPTANERGASLPGRWLSPSPSPPHDFDNPGGPNGTGWPRAGWSCPLTLLRYPRSTSHAGHETQAHSPPSQPKPLPCASLRTHAGGRAAPSGCNACAAPTSSADAIIDSPEDYCGRHHVCRGIWGGVRHPLFFWLVWQHIPGGPLHASSPASAVLARPWRCDLGRRHSGMLLPPTLSAREVGVACHLDCPRHPHRHDMQANLVIQDDPRASGAARRAERRGRRVSLMVRVTLRGQEGGCWACMGTLWVTV